MKIILSALRIFGSALLVAILAVVLIGFQTTEFPKTTVFPKTTLIGSAGAATPEVYYQTAGYNNSVGTAVGTTNHTICGGFITPQNGLSVGHITVYSSAASGANLSAVGILDSAGVMHATAASSTVWNVSTLVTAAFSGGTQTIPAGKSYLCYTSVGTTFALATGSNNQDFFAVGDAGITSASGVWTTTTPPADNIAILTSNDVPAFVLSP